MIENIIFISEFGFSKRDSQRYGFEVIKKRGLNPKVLDISHLSRSGYVEGHDEPNAEEIEFLEITKTKNELESYLSCLDSKDIVICLVETRKESEFLFNILNENSITYGFIFVGELPVFDLQNPIDEWGRPLSEQYLRISSFNLFQALLKKILNSLLFIEIKRFVKRVTFKSERLMFKPRFVVTSGLNSYKKAKISFTNRSCKFLCSHTLDYNIFIDLKESEPFLSKNNYTVFLDDNQPYHPDNLVYDTGPNLAQNKGPEDYYFELNRFFDFFEEIAGIKVVIAAHPRSNYSELTFKPFKERELHYGKTAELIKDCKFVLGHHSTSLGLAAIFSKPILLLSSNVLGSFNANYVHMQSRELGVKVVNISLADQSYQLDLHSLKDSKTYKKYVTKYIKGKNTVEINSWDFFVNSLEKLL